MQYQRVVTEEALLAATSAGATILCGGTDLLVKMRAGLARPASIVDVSELPSLHGIERVGAAMGTRATSVTPRSKLSR